MKPTSAPTPPAAAALDEVRAALAECLAIDRARLASELERLCGRRRPPSAAALQALLERIEAARRRCAERLARRPEPSYPPGLPIVEHREAILEALQAHQVIVVCGETGSGKTTQLPKLGLEAGRGREGLIGHTQPRRIAARSLAGRIAEELGQPLGEAVGFKVRFDEAVGPNTFVKVMTDGILLAETQSDPQLLAYDTLIIDEAHERSLNIDFLLGYLKRLLPKRPDLKLIITSATIDPERFARHFGDAPVLKVSGRTHPVELRYRPGPERGEADRNEAVLEAVEEALQDGPGDILVFLPGERDIRELADALGKRYRERLEVLPLYARLSAARQARVFAPHARRRVVLATNVAETALTVPGIRYVIDTGLARISRHGRNSPVQRLPIEPISQASADQRAGRCGREAPGVCIRLYSEADYLSRPRFTEPEILRSNLATVILQMLALGLGDIEDFPFLDPPDSGRIRDGIKQLFELGAVDARGRLTRLGRRLARFPLDARLARMLLAADREGSLREVLIICAALSIQDPRERPADQQQAADEAHARFADPDSDFIGWLKLWNWFDEQSRLRSQSALRRLCQQHFLSYPRMREWREVHHQLRTIAGELGLRVNRADADYAAIHRALLTGFLSQIAQRSEENEYTGARNVKLQIFPGSGVFKSKKKPKWIVAGEIVETSRRWARSVARIQAEWIEPLAGHLVKRAHFDPHWEKKAGRVVAYEQVSLYGLIIVPRRRVDYSRIDPVESRKLFILHALVRGETQSRLAFFAHNAEQLARIEDLEARSRRRDLLESEGERYSWFDALVPDDICRIDQFERWYRQADPEVQKRFFLDAEQLLRRDDPAARDPRRFPEALDLGVLRLPLSYHFEPGHPDDGVTVTVPLAALNQLDPERCAWLVPGLLEEKITALIKGLPKALRRHFVPAPQFAQACAEALTPEAGPLLRALSEKLERMTGVRVPEDQWNAAALPDHLRMNVHLVDEDGRLIERSRDLEALRARHGGRAAERIESLADAGHNRDDLERWDFGDLPETVQLERNGLQLAAFPALVEDGERVHLRLIDDPQRAARLHRLGTRRLFMKQARGVFRKLLKDLPKRAEIDLLYAAVDRGKPASALLLETLAEHALFDADPSPIRDAAAFAARSEAAQGALHRLAGPWAECVHAILGRHQALRKALRRLDRPAWLEALRDLDEQLSRLVFPGFFAAFDLARLQHFPRYLDAAAQRIEKLPLDPARDARLMARVRPYWRAVRERLGDEPVPQDPRLAALRWMVEEFRVSLFAQALGTAESVSERRLDELLAELDRR